MKYRIVNKITGKICGPYNTRPDATFARLGASRPDEWRVEAYEPSKIVITRPAPKDPTT